MMPFGWNTQHDHENGREDLKFAVKQAFEKRNTGSAKEVQKALEKMRALLKKHNDPEEIITLPPLPQAKNEVRVTNMADYHWVLRYAIEAVFNDPEAFDKHTLRTYLKEDLSHELQHAVAGAHEPELTIYYTVRFEDEGGGRASYQPLIRLEGKIKIGTLRNMIEAAKKQSSGDTFILG